MVSEICLKHFWVENIGTKFVKIKIITDKLSFCGASFSRHKRSKHDAMERQDWFL